MPEFLRNVLRELPGAAETLAATARLRAEQTLAGSAPASLPKPFVPEVVEPEPAEPTIEVFTLANIQVYPRPRPRC
jgi:hypothetical protein